MTDKSIEKGVSHQPHPKTAYSNTRVSVHIVRNRPLSLERETSSSLQVFIINSLIYSSRSILGMPFYTWDRLSTVWKYCSSQSPKSNLTQKRQECHRGVATGKMPFQMIDNSHHQIPTTNQRSPFLIEISNGEAKLHC